MIGSEQYIDARDNALKRHVLNDSDTKNVEGLRHDYPNPSANHLEEDEMSLPLNVNLDNNL